MRNIFRSLLNHSACIVFVTTTPVPSIEIEPRSSIHPGCIERRIVLTQAVAAEFANVSICDLQGTLTSFCPGNYSDHTTGAGHCPIQRSHDVHFFTRWQQFTALTVVQA